MEFCRGKHDSRSFTTEDTGRATWVRHQDIRSFARCRARCRRSSLDFEETSLLISAHALLQAFNFGSVYTIGRRLREGVLGGATGQSRRRSPISEAPPGLPRFEYGGSGAPAMPTPAGVLPKISPSSSLTSISPARRPVSWCLWRCRYRCYCRQVAVRRGG